MKKDYSKMSKEELIEELKRSNPKKYGLVWEPKDEDVVEECKTKLPVLNEVTKWAIEKAPGDPTNIIIEGDNYHALSVLNYTHQGKIDVIYIDPPYNTGAKNWKYNNDYVDSEDTFRHSKWLSMMERRLKLAKTLLKSDGVLICAIDDNEQAHLGVLIEELFTTFDQHVITVVHNPKGVQGKNFSYVHEYAIFVIPSDKKLINNRTLSEEEMYVSNLRNWGSESLRTDARNCFYPILIRKNKIVGFGDVADKDFHPKSSNEIKKDGTILVWPIDEKGTERKWRYARQSVEEIIKVLQIKEGRNGLQIMIAKDYGTFKSVWDDKRYDASEYGTKLLRKILPGCDFDFPKSLYLVEDCIKAVLHNKETAIILDFFAGSGTTGHAVMMLNEEDGGKRQFILCTNNENKIAEKVTYPRIRGVIRGYGDAKNKVEGIPANVRYLKTDFINKTASKDEQKMRITERCTEMLCLREGIFGEVADKKSYKIFKQGGRILAVYYSVSHKDLPKLKKELDKIEGNKVLYCFTLDSSGLDAKDFSDWQDVRLEPIPQKILDIYKEIHEY